MKQVRHHDHPANIYASGPLDRADKLRADDAALRAAFEGETARLYPVWRDLNLISLGDAPLAQSVRRDQVPSALCWENTVFLGLDEAGVASFAVDFDGAEDPPEFGSGALFEDLRKVGPMMPEADGAIAAYARALAIWNRRHRFCGLCGAPTQGHKGGHERRCTGDTCGTPHFPRTDPAVIMLVHDGADRVLLGRQASWPPGRVSVLAGFVEPGESLEDAVAREVMEEVGVPVRGVTYHSSQPWPFPSSIMLGFMAQALATDLSIATDEIEQAHWITREQVLNSPQDETFCLPRQDSIAYRLIQDWLKTDPR